MPPVSIAITKEFPYRDNREKFTNVYTYNIPNPGVSEAQQAIQRLVRLETGLHSGLVSFVEGRAWTSGGTKEQNESILITDLSGTGDQIPEDRMFSQAVLEVEWRTDRPSATGKPVYLRKYFRTFSMFGQNVTQGVMNGSTPLPPEVLSALSGRVSNFARLLTEGGTYEMIAPSGRRVTRPPGLPKYLSIHELKY